jgi:hypothetical protein
MALTRRPTVASRSLAEQLNPVLEMHRSIQARSYGRVDIEATRQRIHSGRIGFNAESVLSDVESLTQPFFETATAMEISGIASTHDIWSLEARRPDPNELVLAWANAESLPVDAMLRLARRVAAVIGNAILSQISKTVMQGVPRGIWKRSQCPCCGASPDIAFVTEARRYLVCWRCDTAWATQARGCLGCNADAAPTLVRVPSPYLGYELAICNSCGRYLKERRGGFIHEILVERALTAGLDEAARRRGLRT